MIDHVMELPETLTPSKMSSFQSCGLAFRLSAIDRIAEPPTAPTVTGTITHETLEQLYLLPAGQRTPADAAELAADTLTRFAANDPEWAALDPDPATAAEIAAASAAAAARYFQLEDPTRIEPIGLELRVETEIDTAAGPVKLRGIIDRLDLVDGELVITDYKTGRVPDPRFDHSRLAGVHFYALLCEHLLGRRPAEVRLLYLSDPATAVTDKPTDQSTRGLTNRISAMWSAIGNACRSGNFQPRPSKLCDWCGYHAYCPAQGGALPAPPTTAETPVTVGASS